MGRIYICVSILAIFAVTEAIEPFVNNSCGHEGIDIVFAIDCSSSIWKPDFDRQIEFIRNITQQFDVGNGPKQTRIGVIGFADRYYLQFHLWQNNRRDLLDTALRKVRHRYSRKTNTASALHFMRKYMFTYRYGSRKHAVHVAIVITDGKSQDSMKTVQSAGKLKASGVHVFAIGVGDGVEPREIDAIASSPSTDYVLNVDNYNALDSMKFIMANDTCQGPRLASTTTKPTIPPPVITTHPSRPIVFEPPIRRIEFGSGTLGLLPPTADPESDPNLARVRTLPTSAPDVEIQADVDPRLNVTNCGGKPAEIYFALDASNSIWPEDFKKQLAFVRDLISLFDISKGKTRVGLVTFSDTVNSIFDLNHKQEKEHLFKKMQEIQYMSGRTDTAMALQFIMNQGFSMDIARQEVAHIVILFTDGISRYPHETARVAELAKRKGIYLFSIGIGTSVERTELRDIASDPDDEFVFHVSNFSVLNTIKDILAIKTCAVQPVDFVADKMRTACMANDTTDLMFVYDSAQLGIKKTRKITKFVYDVTSALDTSNNKLKIGRMMENCLTGADTYLTSQKEALDFDDIHFPDMRNLIRRVASQGFTESYNARRDAKKIAVLFLDEDMENLKQASDEIQRLRDTHTMVVTIGTTDVHTAAAFASRPPNDYIVHIPAYKYLLAAKSTLLGKLCRVISM